MNRLTSEQTLCDDCSKRLSIDVCDEMCEECQEKLERFAFALADSMVTVLEFSDPIVN